jgi:hypothetical protein
MAAHIPEFRRAINSRTHDREWVPEAVEIYRRSPFARAGDYALAIAIGVALAIVLVEGLAS